MTQILTATFRDGQLVPDGPVNLLEGQKVYIAVATDPESVQSLKLRPEEEEWDDPELNRQRADRIAALEPLETTLEEDAKLQAFRMQVKEYTINAMRREMEQHE